MAKYRAALGLMCACSVLSACANLTANATPQTAAMPLLDGNVIAAVPEGYCIETGASRPRDGFALMASCATVSGAGALPEINGVVTVQVAAAKSPFGSEAAALEALLETDAGRALLSQSGDGETVTVRDTTVANGAVTVQFDDQAPPPIAGLQQTEWRGFFDLNGHFATVAVRGLDVAPLDAEDGQALLQRVISAMQQINTGQGFTVEAAKLLPVWQRFST